jgi:hypothetical protein
VHEKRAIRDPAEQSLSYLNRIGNEETVDQSTGCGLPQQKQHRAEDDLADDHEAAAERTQAGICGVAVEPVRRSIAIGCDHIRSS